MLSATHAVDAQHVAREAQAGHRDEQADRVDQHEERQLVVHRDALPVPEGPVAAADPGHDDGRADRDDRGRDGLVAQRTAAPAVHQQVVAPDVDDEGASADDAELQQLAVEDVDGTAQPRDWCIPPGAVTIVEPNSAPVGSPTVRAG